MALELFARRHEFSLLTTSANRSTFGRLNTICVQRVDKEALTLAAKSGGTP